MTDLSKLFLTEKHQALLTMALDRYLTWMHTDQCCRAAIDMYESLERWVRNYDLHAAAEITKALNYVDELEQLTKDAEPYPADQFAQDLVDSLDDDDAVTVYEMLCKRLGAEGDVDVPNDKLKELMRETSVFERDPRQIDIEEAIKAKQEELIKLHAARASQVPTEVNPNEALPSDVEPKDYIDSVFGPDPNIVALRSLNIDTKRAG